MGQRITAMPCVPPLHPSIYTEHLVAFSWPHLDGVWCVECPDGSRYSHSVKSRIHKPAPNLTTCCQTPCLSSLLLPEGKRFAS